MNNNLPENQSLLEGGPEPTLTVDEIAEVWKLDKDTVTRIFKGHKRVLHFGSRKRCILRVPISVFREVSKELSFCNLGPSRK